MYRLMDHSFGVHAVLGRLDILGEDSEVVNYMRHQTDIASKVI